MELDLAQPLPDIVSREAASDRLYHRAEILVRLQKKPLAITRVWWTGEGLSAGSLANQLWQQTGEEINHFLRKVHQEPVSEIPVSGVVFEAPSDASKTEAGEESLALRGSSPLVTVAVATRDRPEHLARCIPAVLSMNYRNFEVLVVDNASQGSQTLEVVQRASRTDARVHYLREDRPGLSWARNRALERAAGEMIAYVDDDATPDHDWLGQLVEGFSIAPNVGCVTGLTLPGELETQAQEWCEEFGTSFRGRAFDPLRFDLGRHRSKNPLYPYLASEFGAGNNMAFRVEIARALGGFDVALGPGTPTCSSDDMDMFFRTIAAGYMLVYQPTATVRHFHRRTYAELKKQLNGFGCGFFAYLTKTLIDDPRRAFELMVDAPHALKYLLDPNSARNRRKCATYPAELTRSELSGMLAGPAAYWASRRRSRRLIS